MREIKFRAWDGSKMLSQKEIAFFPSIMSTNPTTLDSGLKSLQNDMELMQYTGLKDKNGKEIYEGDVLSLDNDSLEETIVLVYFDVDEAAWLVGDGMESLGMAVGESEVIGNIYENPELLEK